MVLIFVIIKTKLKQKQLKLCYYKHTLYSTHVFKMYSNSYIQL